VALIEGKYGRRTSPSKYPMVLWVPLSKRGYRMRIGCPSFPAPIQVGACRDGRACTGWGVSAPRHHQHRLCTRLDAHFAPVFQHSALQTPTRPALTWLTLTAHAACPDCSHLALAQACSAQCSSARMTQGTQDFGLLKQPFARAQRGCLPARSHTQHSHTRLNQWNQYVCMNANDVSLYALLCIRRAQGR